MIINLFFDKIVFKQLHNFVL